MVVQLNPPASRTIVGQVQAYLGKNHIEEIRRFRDLFGGVTLQGHHGLKIATALDRAGDLYGVDIDPGTYTVRPLKDELMLDLDVAFDWVRAQADLGLPVIRTAGHRIRPGQVDELRRTLQQSHAIPVTITLVLDAGWLGKRHIDTLESCLRSADRDISLVLAAVFDPLDKPQHVAGYRRILHWAAESGRKLEVLRTDLVGLAAVLNGAALASVGLTTSTRHFSLPIPAKNREDYEERQVSPLIYVPKLMHWQRGKVLAGLRTWRGDGVTDCACPACQHEPNLLRFAEVYDKSIPPAVSAAVRDHDSYAISAVAQSILGAPDPLAELARLRTEARNLVKSVKAVRKVMLDLPTWFDSWR